MSLWSMNWGLRNCWSMCIVCFHGCFPYRYFCRSEMLWSYVRLSGLKKSLIGTHLLVEG